MSTNFALTADNYQSTVSTARSSGGASLVVASASGLAAPTGSQFYRLTIADATTGAILTHLKATGISGSTFTIAGTLDGYSDPATIPVGAVVRVGVSSGTVSAIQSAINAIETSYISTSQINVANGVAGLDSSGNLVGTILFRQDTAANLSGVVLAAGQPAYATDTKKFAIGDGSSTFSALSPTGLALIGPYATIGPLVPLAGQMAVATDTLQVSVGDGSSTFGALPQLNVVPYSAGNPVQIPQLLIGDGAYISAAQQFVVTNGEYSNQWSVTCLSRNTTNATPVIMTVGSTSPIIYNLSNPEYASVIMIPSGYYYACEIDIIAYSASYCALYSRRCLIANKTGTATIIGSVQTVGTDIIDSGFSPGGPTITADSTHSALQVQVTGIAGTTIIWSAVVRMTQTQ